MQPSDFEKQVQEKLKELKLDPAGRVWEKVEASLPQKRKRRYLIYWLLLPLLLAGAFSIYLLSKPGGSTVMSEANPATQPAAPSTYRKGEDGTAQTAPVELAESPAEKAVAPNISASQFEDARISNTKNPQVLSAGKENPEVNAFPVRAAKPGMNETASDKVFVLKNDNAHKEVGDDNYLAENIMLATADVTADTLASIRFLLPSQREESIVITSKQEWSPGLQERSMPVDLPLAIKFREDEVKKAGWTLGLEAGVGKTFAQDVLFGLAKSASADANPLYSPGTVGSGGGSLYNPPSSLKAGSYLSIALLAKKNIHKNWDLGTGIQFARSTLRRQTGDRVDSPAVFSTTAGDISTKQSYRLGSNNTFVSNIYSLEFPLFIAYHPIRQLPLTIQAGVIPGVNLSSNFLVYDASRSRYYSDGELYNRLLIKTSFGATFTIAQHARLPVTLGYRYNYQATSLLKKQFGTQRLANSWFSLGCEF